MLFEQINRNFTFVTSIDLHNAFDLFDRELLEYKVLRSAIDGNLYRAVKSLYKDTHSCFRLDERYMNWRSEAGRPLTS